jgi:quercetin dioxygenase-like cupin family protein
VNRLAFVLALLPTLALAERPAPPRYTVKSAEAEVWKPKGGKLEARVLVDGQTAYSEQASLSILSLSSRTELPLHRQTSAKILVVLDGVVRIKGLAGGKGNELYAGDAAYVPANVAASVLSTCCKRGPTRLLVLYAPAGPEKPWRGDVEAARTTTTILRGEERAIDAAAPQPRVVHHKDVEELVVAGGKARVKILFAADNAGDKAAYVGHLTAEAGAAIPEHVHADEAELLYITSGKGSMTVDGQVLAVEAGMAVVLPPGVKHSFQTDRGLSAVQFYTPSGPEQRFKQKTVMP